MPRPRARAPRSFAKYLAHQIELSDKTQLEIAHEIGYEKPNIITMFKQGTTKVPINKVPMLAKALGLDPAHLLRLALREYAPEILDTIEEALGRAVTHNEFEIIEAVRNATDDDPKASGKELAAVAAIFGPSLRGSGDTRGRTKPSPDRKGSR